MSAENADFSVSLDKERVGLCAVYGCDIPPTLIATLAYCFCDAVKDEHGHPGYDGPEVDRNEVTVCERHGALIAHSWESFERLRTPGNPT